jgi:hypothetical protein
MTSPFAGEELLTRACADAVAEKPAMAMPMAATAAITAHALDITVTCPALKQGLI